MIMYIMCVIIYYDNGIVLFIKERFALELAKEDDWNGNVDY